ncbi:MAG: SDR family NAD(P)-dependent oxidoreductase, partial [Gemmatimonadaceae bacterium]|nr:SDR family NAD(P)-dependent oxidoreductase [Gemmatimonadaceae bacterium]
MKIDLTGKNALVTGGTRGIGRSIAEMLAECGAQVAITGRDVGKAQEIAKEISGNAQGFGAELSDTA